MYGYCDVLMFDGETPSWEEVFRIVHEGGNHDRLVSHGTFKNRLTETAVLSMAMLWAGQYVKTPNRIKLGTGAPPPGQSGPLTDDEDCWIPDNTTMRVCDVKTTYLRTNSEFGITYDVDEANDKMFTEALLIDEDGFAWAHVMLPNMFKATADKKTIALAWTIQHAGL